MSEFYERELIKQLKNINKTLNEIKNVIYANQVPTYYITGEEPKPEGGIGGIGYKDRVFYDNGIDEVEYDKR